ncbi:MAG: CTP synthase [Mycoplasma sp.]|nr:CTP synthase [Mycoplasma sp.]
MKKTKFIFITGGVISGLGKGVSGAALGSLLKSYGYKIFVQKFDPYYNVDPGTLSPYQHGEVYVTADGGETDLDLGHYERFINQNLTKKSSFTQGKLLEELLQQEREGYYRGHTIQVIPHVTNKIIYKLDQSAWESKADFIITEIGGTIGDIEIEPFTRAIWEFSKLYPKQCYFVHCAFLLYLETSKEFKTKPIQHSVKSLNNAGLSPNMLLVRSNKEINSDDIIYKVASKTLIPENSVISLPNIDNIYKLPLYFAKKKMAENILKFFNLEVGPNDLSPWKKYVNLLNKPKSKTFNIAMIGKYVELEDAYKSIIEALNISANYSLVNIKLIWINVEKLNKENLESNLESIDGAVVLPGFGKRGFENKILALTYLRKNNIPTLGICFGMQAMIVEQARHKGIEDATSSEVSKKGVFVIDLIEGKNKKNIGGTLRLGNYETSLRHDSLVYKLYKNDFIIERHRHRYEVNPKYVRMYVDEDFIVSGVDTKTYLIEFCELKSHKFYVGTQAHPEFNATPLKPHPLFSGFIKAMF